MMPSIPPPLCASNRGYAVASKTAPVLMTSERRKNTIVSASLWRDGRELYCVDAGRRMVAVPIADATEFMAGQPATLFDTPLQPLPFPASGVNALISPYDVTDDGQRFLLAAQIGAGPDGSISAPLTVVLNWPAAIRQ
jgi:hypothetical protein